MATDFTNKYMQVFQTYDEFGEHSADYVKGEDHVAFLIEENEVIYWLYLEQVWRPLNVRTTTTGELEDGRTKVAVRLEYVEGGQKYTSVPNIPDPERITSMSRFLEDYPDIEEVNVSGTVNLTDLSYAFAGSKIKDFSMLDTSNVTYFNYIFKDINDETRDLFLKINQSINDIIAGDIVLNNLTIESTNEKIISTVKLGESDIKNSLIIKGNINFELIYDTLTSSKFYNFNNIKTDANVNLSPIGSTVHVNYNNINCRELTLGWNTINNTNSGYTFKTHCDKIIIENGNNDAYSARDWRKIECYDVKEFILKTKYDNPFSGGIKFNNNENIKITISDVINIGNFWFTTTIVDDAFYAKYAQYNIPISIFQYKTTFEEVADVNISSEVDKDLIYFPLQFDFDCSAINIEINNVIQLYIDASHHPNGTFTFNKFILDNSNLNLEYEDYPLDDCVLTNIKANDGYISGNYACYFTWNSFGSADSRSRITISPLFKNITLWDYSNVTVNDANILVNNNIKVNHNKSNSNPVIRCMVNNIDISALKDENNIVTCGLEFGTNNNIKLLYINDITLNILKYGYGNIYIYNLLDYINKENNNIINDSINITYNNDYISNYDEFIFIENIYLHGNVAIRNFLAHASNNGDYGEYGYVMDVSISNIYGENITLVLPEELNDQSDILNIYCDENAFKHIDISKVKPNLYWADCYITIFKNLDNESTINLITKLIDNSSQSSPTLIYMYRSQANIIGEENIAAAVAKNYEFAIIEN